MPFKLLFLCTGNYYRSRFAEMLFNWLAREAELNWAADSRGIGIDNSINNVGPISIHALKGLQARGIIVHKGVRFPVPLQEQDLQAANLIIALKEVEHRLLLEKRFPLWLDRVEYWQVHDLDMAPPDEALAIIEQEVKRLILRLS
jgi:protein-tyrosine phosphatase